MPELQEELKSIEKDLSLLLVRFMKLCDAVDETRAVPPTAAAPKNVNPAPSKPTAPPDLRAYV